MTNERLALVVLLVAVGCSTSPTSPTDAGSTDASLDTQVGRDTGGADAPAVDGGSGADVAVDRDASAEPFEGCAGDAVRIDGAWGETAIDTADYGEFGSNTLVIRVVPPLTATGTSVRRSSWSEYAAAPIVRHAVFSTRPCDFDVAHALLTGSGTAMVSSEQIAFSFPYTFGPATRFSTQLVPGETYYINVRNEFTDGSPSCGISDCRMRGGLPP